jgi:hypothetical protein
MALRRITARSIATYIRSSANCWRVVGSLSPF